MATHKLDDPRTNYLGEQYRMSILDQGAESAAPLEQAVARNELLASSNIKVGGDAIVGGDLILKGSAVTELESADGEVTGRLAVVKNGDKYELQFIVTKPGDMDPIVLEDDVTAVGA